MADSTKLLLIGGGVAFAWWQGWLAPLGIPGPSGAAAPAPVTPSAGSPAPAATPSAPVAPPAATPAATPSQLASIYTSMVAAAANDPQVVSGQATPDLWNYYLVQVYPALGSAPDPISVFGNRNPMTAAAYWAQMSQWLKTNKGLSGHNAYAGLAGIARRHGWGF